MSKTLLSPANLQGLALKNKVVMAPMTRSRAINNIPNELMAEYYGQRAAAGLIITEGTAPSPNALGYARIPCIFNAEQATGWRLVTDAVHAKGGKIFVQLMHTGRVTHPLNLPAGAEVVAPSAAELKQTQMYTDQEGMKDIPAARPFRTEEISAVIQEYVKAAKHAIDAGFDGVEIHGANGYLVQQFINPGSNQRNDEYGGSVENRIRFAVEVTKAVSDAIGKEKTGIRLSPQGVFNEMLVYGAAHETYDLLSQGLNDLGIAYIHLVDHSHLGAPEVPQEIVDTIRKNFQNTLILSGGYNAERAEEALTNGNADLVAFGTPFITNPDLVARFEKGLELNMNFDQSTFYTPGPKGYTDFPTA